MNIFHIENKVMFRFVSLFCGGLILFALGLQYFVSQTPCPLCIVQRFFYLLIGLVAFSASLLWPKNMSVHFSGILIMILSLVGGAVAGRQVWLQQHLSLADPTKCSIPLGSFLDSVILALGGVGSCSVRGFTLFGLSIADWSFMCFIFLFCASFFVVARFIWVRREITRE